MKTRNNFPTLVSLCLQERRQLRQLLSQIDLEFLNSLRQTCSVELPSNAKRVWNAGNLMTFVVNTTFMNRC